MAGRPRNEIDLSSYSGRFAANLRRLREKRGLSVEQLAERCGVAPQTVWRWEAGERMPPFDFLPTLARALGMVGVRGIMP